MKMAAEKRHLLGGESLDPASLICVNPYEVNPLSNTETSYTATLSADIPFKVECSVSQRSPDEISSGAFYGSQQKRIKLEMEEFGDLTPFVSQKRMFTNSVDELNTPIFDKDAFDFEMNNYKKNVHADLHVMLKYDTSGSGPYNQSHQSCYNNSKSSSKDSFLNAGSTIIPLENNNVTDAVYSPSASENGTYIEKMSPTGTDAFDYDLSSVSVNYTDSRNSSYGSVTPEGSEKSFKLVEPKLSLDINIANLNNQNSFLDINTPTLIAEVVNLDATGFNILDLINDDNLPVTTEDILQPSQYQYSLPKVNASKFASKHQRKRRVKYSDDDEDYVPPTKKSSRRINDYSDDDSEDEVPRKKGRGRPPKRTQSISSEGSIGKDGDVSRYRELRDKNNEASRKSRLKRKTKELELEKEAEELHSKNIKLKAQVEELEKMVNSFRDNLFKIMIKK